MRRTATAGLARISRGGTFRACAVPLKPAGYRGRQPSLDAAVIAAAGYAVASERPKDPATVVGRRKGRPQSV